jgi:uncharacterized protein (TIGR04168 family)
MRANRTAVEPVTLAVVGDVHRCWGQQDDEVFARSDVAGVLFVGDLPDGLHRGLHETARAIARVPRPAVLIPGNHDGPGLASVWREATPLGGRSGWLSGSDLGAPVEALTASLGTVALGGYSHHVVGGVSVIAARPHAMDGRRLTFARRLLAYGVRSMADSARLLCRLVDEVAAGPLVFLAHNGPRGVGSGRAAPWHLGPLDLGDPDLQAAVAHAVSTGRGPVAVVAGHFHRGRTRQGIVAQGGVLYVNAAEVPRVRAGRRHHVRLSWDGVGWSAGDVWAEAMSDER